MAKKKYKEGEFEQLFDSINTALTKVKQLFFVSPAEEDICGECSFGEQCQNTGQKNNMCKRNDWLKKPHPNNSDLVITTDTFMWITFWIESIWKSSTDWQEFFIRRKKNISSYTGAIPRLARKSDMNSEIKLDIKNFLKNPLSSGKKSDYFVKFINQEEIKEQIAYAGWFLFNQYYSGDHGELVAYPEGEDDSFFKPLLILWKLFFTAFSEKDKQVLDFLSDVENICKTSEEKLYIANTAQKLSEIFSAPSTDISYRKHCEKAADIFWKHVRNAMKATSSAPVHAKPIYTIGGQTMYDAYTIFNTNPSYQRVYSILLEDYSRINHHEPPTANKICTNGELLSYLSFFNKMEGLEKTDEFLRYLGEPFALAMNNPCVQEVYFHNKQILTNLEHIYGEYYYNTYLNAKFSDEKKHTSAHEFLKMVPMIRYNLLDMGIVEAFLEKQNAVFKYHLWGECFGQFRLRYAEESDIDTLEALQKSDGDENRNVYMRAKKTELECALRERQLFVIEDLNKYTDCAGKTVQPDFAAKRIAAFAILCPEILPYDKDASKPGTASYNSKIIEQIKTMNKTVGNYASFNTCFVSQSYRGVGFQRLFLLLMEKMAKRLDKSAIVCTVSSKNTTSYANFMAAGYQYKSEVVYEIDGERYQRDFLELKL